MGSKTVGSAALTAAGHLSSAALLCLLFCGCTAYSGAVSDHFDGSRFYNPEGGEDVQIVFVPARHGSGRGPLSENRTLWGGFVIDAPDGQVYFAGDTGHGRFVEDIAARFDRIRLAILPIGNYEKRWFMKAQHMNPDDAVAVHRTLRAGQSMGMHYGTFAEHPEQSIDAHEKGLVEAVSRQEVAPDQIWVLEFGEGRDVGQAPRDVGSRDPG